MGAIMANIRTYDLVVHEVKVENVTIFVERG
jgi:hypothetical protein